MNQFTDRINTGTVGELLVQIRLLQYGIQAAAPIKDSGNDLIAVNGEHFRAISVRTTTGDTYNKPRAAAAYHVLAVVRLIGEGREIDLDDSEVFLIPRQAVEGASLNCHRLREYLILTNDGRAGVRGADALTLRSSPYRKPHQSAPPNPVNLLGRQARLYRIP